MSDLEAKSEAIAVATTPHPGATYLARLAPGSRRAQAQALEVIAQVVSGGRETAATLPWHTLRYHQTQAIRTALVARYAARTVNRHLAALRGVLRECWRLELVDADSYLRAAAVNGIDPGDQDDPPGRALPAAELAALVASASSDAARGARDRAVVLVMALGGLRVEETTSIAWDDVREGGVLRVRGKGRRVRLVPVPAIASDALEAWNKIRAICPPPGQPWVNGPRENDGETPTCTHGGLAMGTCGQTGPPLHVARFAASQRGRKTRIDETRIFPLTPRAVAYRLEALSDAAGIPHVSPHDLRRTYITTLLEAGVDVLLVAKLAGHRNVQTTRRYDRRELAEKRAAVAKLEGFLS